MSKHESEVSTTKWLVIREHIQFLLQDRLMEGTENSLSPEYISFNSSLTYW